MKNDALDSEELEHIRRVFDTFDDNGDGNITF